MSSYSISRQLLEELPTLAASLAGAGVAGSGAATTALYSASEHVGFSANDIIVDYSALPSVPFLVSSRDGHPARIGFSFADMAFGHSLIAELIRANPQPSFGEPDTGKLLEQAARAAQSRAPVLIEGETGTGKEGLSRFVHFHSRCATGPFVAINCAALPDTMAEAMLFGHERGSFTGATSAGEGLFRAAGGGTLMLDEVAELPLLLQAKLLRALQEREVLPVGATRPVPVNVRIIAAANRSLSAEVAAGRFRADLYWRLNVLALTLSPLRSRRQDVRAIAAAILIRHAREGENFAWPTPEALDALMSHDWPGNARELDNVLQRALLQCVDGRIDRADLQIEAVADRSQGDLQQVARSSQAEAIRAVLSEVGGHRRIAAARLGVSERTLRYRLAEMRVAA